MAASVKTPSTAASPPALVEDWAFRVDSLYKRFGGLAANDNITVRVEPGEVYGLLGPTAPASRLW